jgi:hypothetical protein
MRGRRATGVALRLVVRESESHHMPRSAELGRFLIELHCVDSRCPRRGGSRPGKRRGGRPSGAWSRRSERNRADMFGGLASRVGVRGWISVGAGVLVQLRGGWCRGVVLSCGSFLATGCQDLANRLRRANGKVTTHQCAPPSRGPARQARLPSLTKVGGAGSILDRAFVAWTRVARVGAVRVQVNESNRVDAVGGPVCGFVRGTEVLSRLP